MLIGDGDPMLCPKFGLFQVNPLQLFSMAEWPWDVHSLLFDVEQVETVKIFLRFGTEWWNDILPGTGRSITTLPLRQVWALRQMTHP